MPYLDPPDTIVMEATLEARNLLARKKLGDIVYRHLGWALGRGGYDDDGSSSTAASQTITIGIQPVDGDTVTIGEEDLTARALVSNGTTEFLIGVDTDATAVNLANTIEANPILMDYFTAAAASSVVTVTSKVTGGIGNFIPLAASGPWATLGGSTFQGGTGESGGNPVKITPIVDNATEAFCLLEVLSNTFDVGDGFSLNGCTFFIDVNFAAGPTIPVTVQNIVDAINDSDDVRVKRMVLATVDTGNPNRFFVTTLITGQVSNAYPVVLIDLPFTTNFQIVTPMGGGLSSDLEDPAYPVPSGVGTTLLPFVLPDGAIEQPDETSVSFVVRCPEGMVGLNGYGEIGIYVEVLQSNFSPEVGQFLVLSFTLGSPVIVNVQSHNLNVDDPVTLTTTGSLPTGLSAGTTYYIQNPTADSFELSAVPAGPSIAASGIYSGDTTLNTGLSRQVLYAVGHFPLQSKNDRMLLTYRVVIHY